MGFKTELKNGTTVDSQRIKTFYDCWLKPLFNEDPNRVALLYLYAEDDSFAIEEDVRRWFIRLSFLEEDGTLDPDFRNVILSAVTLDREASNLIIERPEVDRAKPKPGTSLPAKGGQDDGGR